MTAANPTPFNVPAGYYDGHLGKLTPPTAAQNFVSTVKLNMHPPGIIPLKNDGTAESNGHTGRVELAPPSAPNINASNHGTYATQSTKDSNMPVASAGESNKTTTSHSVKNNNKVEDASKKAENIKTVRAYSSSYVPSTPEQTFTNIAATAVAVITDPIYFTIIVVIILYVLNKKSKANNKEE